MSPGRNCSWVMGWGETQISIFGKWTLSQWSITAKPALPTPNCFHGLCLLLTAVWVLGVWEKFSWGTCSDPVDMTSKGSWGWGTHLQDASLLTCKDSRTPWGWRACLLYVASHPQSPSDGTRMVSDVCASHLAVGFHETRVFLKPRPKSSFRHGITFA